LGGTTMNLKLQLVEHDQKRSDVDILEYPIDISTVHSYLNAINTKEADEATHDGAESRKHLHNHLRLAEKLTINEEARSRVIEINRTEPFDPVTFMNHPDLAIEEQDIHSIMLEEVDPSDISLESMVQGDTVIRGEEYLKRSKATGYIRLDAKIFQTLWENQYLIPEHWKGTDDNPKHIFFDGTVLKSHCGRFIINLYWGKTSWDKDKKWRWTYCRLDIGGWRREDISAVIKEA
jgi:hypothetical protein